MSSIWIKTVGSGLQIAGGIKMKKIMLAALVLALLSSGASAQRLVVLHTNDSHSQIVPIRTGRDNGKGGVDRRLQFIDSVRAVYGKGKVLVLDAGDYNQGTPYFTVARGDLEVELMNVLGYEAVALGNHEFDNGQTELARRLSKTKFPTLCCNYDFSATPLARYIKPWTIIRRGGLKIGIVGATSRLENVVMASHLDNIVRLNAVDEVNRWAAYLKEKKNCDIVIFLSHLGYSGGSVENPSDTILAGESRNIDFIIGGHSHTFIKKPLIVKNKDGKDVVIVTAGCSGVEMGELKIW